MEFSEYDALKLDNQVCFPLYAAAREVTKLYRPYLDALNLTYTQYITMMVLWENRSCSAKKLGEKLYLDSGTADGRGDRQGFCLARGSEIGSAENGGVHQSYPRGSSDALQAAV